MNDYTPHKIKEWIKCRDDILYFAENYIKIVTPTEGIINFKPYEWQKEALLSSRKIEKSYKERQSGKTTVLTIMALHEALFKTNRTIIVMAVNNHICHRMRDMLLHFYDYLPEFFKSDIKINKNNIWFDTDSTITFSSNANSLIGRNVNLTLLDEEEFFDTPTRFELYSRIVPIITVSQGRFVSYSS